MNRSKPSFNRRRWLQQTTIAGAAFHLPLVRCAGQTSRSPSEKITLGVIGLGARGVYVMNQFIRQPDVRVVALCDVDQSHYRDREPGKGPQMGLQPIKDRVDRAYDESGQGVFATTDFRELCERDDVDAVLIATPDHWHALCTQIAVGAGKDVYCEKPVTHTFAEGQAIYRMLAGGDAVFQTGTQQRSDARFRRAVELVRNGHLGKIQSIEVGLPPGYREPQGDTKITDPPTSLDYEMWCGPAAKLPYMRARHHRWWRGHSAYGGGVLMDWIGHHNDIAHWAMDLDGSGPTKVEAVGWTSAETDVYDTPADYEIRCEYESGVVSSIANRHKLGVRFVGESGWVYVTRGKIQASDTRWISDAFVVGDDRVYQSDNHVRNFLDCVKSRKSCIAPAETAHRSITPGHLSYISQALGRPLRWDAKTETVLDDPSANELLNRNAYREPWNRVASDFEAVGKFPDGDS